jgi:DnaJ-class molecular chaperone
MSILIILIIIFIFGYYLSLKAHPFTKCKLCNGRGRHFGTMYTYAYRRCSKCGGSGRKDRLGVRLFVNRSGTGSGSKSGSRSGGGD